MNEHADKKDGHDGSRGSDGRRTHESRATNPLRLLVWLVAALLLVVVAIAGVEVGRSHNALAGTISVQGTGTVRGAPDTATFNIGVHTTDASASAALAANNQKVQALVAALSSNGVKKKEMQTSGLNIYQNTNNNGVVTGFSVDDSLNVTMHNVKQSGAAIDAAARAVGNGIQLNGISFSISNQSKLLASARSKAMANAHLAAEQLAKAGGTHVRSIVKVSDQENLVPPIYYGPSATGTGFKNVVPVQTGVEAVTVQVSITYSLGG